MRRKRSLRTLLSEAASGPCFLYHRGEDCVFVAVNGILFQDCISERSQRTGFIETKFITRNGFAEVLTAVAERLDAPSNLRAAEGLVLRLRTATATDLVSTAEQLRVALVAVCRRLDAAGAARVTEAVVATVRDPKTALEVRTIFAHVPAAVGSRLDPTKAEALESALVDSLLADLAVAKSAYYGKLLERALTAVCARPGAKSAGRVTEVISGAFRNPQVSPELLPGLAAAFVAVNGQLPPTEAASQVKGAVTALDSLWGARKEPLDRAFIAEAQATVWTRLTRAEAGDHAGKVVVYLRDSFRDSQDGTVEHICLEHALAAVCGHLGPIERSAHANAVAGTLLAALQKSKNEPLATSLHWVTLATFCAPGPARDESGGRRAPRLD